jgi:hypothetical protein
MSAPNEIRQTARLRRERASRTSTPDGRRTSPIVRIDCAQTPASPRECERRQRLPPYDRWSSEAGAGVTTSGCSHRCERESLAWSASWVPTHRSIAAAAPSAVAASAPAPSRADCDVAVSRPGPGGPRRCRCRRRHRHRPPAARCLDRVTARRRGPERAELRQPRGRASPGQVARPWRRRVPSGSPGSRSGLTSCPLENTEFGSVVSISSSP